ncbi:hypothetical protein [Thermobispora bispora]|uniref:NnrS family protein n=1 Tax=Thermobispora bispora (strain ATCC 19993 / DSM 43833 / CBS 139.67 / JCM 10125 / KCTC 9307 / NBRC 14880 / R51) TaxID=469371 RepID=D6Y3V6_THEBD|nr:hypothetical protein [Thermobispora bispora]ADG89058.1 conserved hypothetical protein [Thermobispora bispora DSM 43833]
MTTPPRPQTSAPPGTGQAAARRARPRVTALLALPGALALLAGLDAALLLLELPAPVTWARLRDVHGPLLVLGFVGTLIALERAVALRAPAGFAAPALLGAGAVLLLTPLPERVGGTALLLGAIALIGCYVPLWRRQRGDAVLVQLLGAVLAAGAVTLWLGGVPVPRLIPWLAGFVVLTVAAERVELARIALPAGAERGLLWASGAVAAAITAALLWPAAGYPVLGLALLGLTCWLAAHDVARRTVRGTGLERFTAGCVLAAYAWLGIGAACWLVGGPVDDGARYDAVVHALFLGFTLSMIMAHAPIILPAVLRLPLPYHPVLAAPAGLLHLSLVLRLWAGDALDAPAAWRIGGVLNIAAVLLFAACPAWSALTPARPSRTEARP